MYLEFPVGPHCIFGVPIEKNRNFYVHLKDQDYLFEIIYSVLNLYLCFEFSPIDKAKHSWVSLIISFTFSSINEPNLVNCDFICTCFHSNCDVFFLFSIILFITS